LASTASRTGPSHASWGRRFRFRERPREPHLSGATRVEYQEGGPHFWLTDRAVALGASAGPPPPTSPLPERNPCCGATEDRCDSSTPRCSKGAALVHRNLPGARLAFGRWGLERHASPAVRPTSSGPVCEPGSAGPHHRPGGIREDSRPDRAGSSPGVRIGGSLRARVCMGRLQQPGGRGVCASAAPTLSGLQVRHPQLPWAPGDRQRGLPPSPPAPDQRHTIQEPAVRELLEGPGRPPPAAQQTDPRRRLDRGYVRPSAWACRSPRGGGGGL